MANTPRGDECEVGENISRPPPPIGNFYVNNDKTPRTVTIFFHLVTVLISAQAEIVPTCLHELAPGPFGKIKY